MKRDRLRFFGNLGLFLSFLSIGLCFYFGYSFRGYMEENKLSAQLSGMQTSIEMQLGDINNTLRNLTTGANVE